MAEEHEIGWYAPNGPAAFEVVTDHTGWQPIEPYGVGHLSGCLSGYVESEPGYIRGRTLFGDDPTQYGRPGNIMALPEPSGLLVGVLALFALFGGQRRGR